MNKTEAYNRIEYQSELAVWIAGIENPEQHICSVFGCPNPPANTLYNDRCADHQHIKKINVNLIIKFK